LTLIIAFFEYQYIPVGVLSQRGETAIAENGEFDDIDDEATADGEQMPPVNFTTSSTLVDDPACFYVLSPGVSRHEIALTTGFM